MLRGKGTLDRVSAEEKSFLSDVRAVKGTDTPKGVEMLHVDVSALFEVKYPYKISLESGLNRTIVLLMDNRTSLSSMGVTATTLESDRPSGVSTTTLNEYVLYDAMENAFNLKILEDTSAADSLKLQLFPKLLIDVILHVH